MCHHDSILPERKFHSFISIATGGKYIMVSVKSGKHLGYSWNTLEYPGTPPIFKYHQKRTLEDRNIYSNLLEENLVITY